MFKMDLAPTFTFIECNTSMNGNISSENISADCNTSFYHPSWLITAFGSGEFDALWLPAWKIPVILLSIIVITFGGLGNTFVVITVAKTKQLWTPTNMFIANLAVADIFVCIFDLPLSLHYQLTGNWAFGKVLCHIIMMVFGVVVYTSTLTLTMIAIDRYILIVHPHTRRLSVSHALLIMILIAILAMAVASPIAIFSEFYEFDDFDLLVHRVLCQESFPTPLQKQLYTVVTLIAQFFLPLALILVLYTRIFMTLKEKMQRMSSRKTKTTKMLVAVVTVFAVTWTPFHLYALLLDFKPDIVPGRYLRLIDVLLKVFALSSSCINPLLYGWLNDNYRAAFLSIIRQPMKAPAGIHREDSDECSRARTSASINNKKVNSQAYQNIKPSMPVGDTTINDKNEMVVMTPESPEDQPASAPSNGCTSLNTSQGSSTGATQQTPLLAQRVNQLL